MGEVISFRDNALIELREKVAALGEANADLVAFARGHSGAVAQIHSAALSAMDAEGLDHLIHIVTQDWPDSLGLDAVVIALSAGEQAVRAGTSGVQMVAPVYIDAALVGPAVIMRNVDVGDTVFGPAADLIRAEALIRLDLPAPLGTGLLALGSREAQAFESGHGSELLAFLGGVVSRMISRWLLD
jgi:uncharacterized protein YigA (DUF484 family)